jgi:hypothetical protein
VAIVTKRGENSVINHSHCEKLTTHWGGRSPFFFLSHALPSAAKWSIFSLFWSTSSFFSGSCDSPQKIMQLSRLCQIEGLLDLSLENSREWPGRVNRVFGPANLPPVPTRETASESPIPLHPVGENQTTSRFERTVDCILSIAIFHSECNRQSNAGKRLETARASSRDERIRKRAADVEVRCNASNGLGRRNDPSPDQIVGGWASLAGAHTVCRRRNTTSRSTARCGRNRLPTSSCPVMRCCQSLTKPNVSHRRRSIDRSARVRCHAT